MKKASAKIEIGSKVQRTSYTGLVMVGTVTKIQQIGTMLYANVLDDTHGTEALIPVAALQLAQ
jgi:hypothetical protein